MCLDYLWTKKDIKKWLKTQPDTITAYKVVQLKDGIAYPAIYSEYGSFKKHNKIEDDRRTIETMVKGKIRLTYRKYEAGYHLFLTPAGAAEWKPDSNRYKVLMCKIPKSQITDVGLQKNWTSIITKEFTFAEGDEYLKGKET